MEQLIRGEVPDFFSDGSGYGSGSGYGYGYGYGDGYGSVNASLTEAARLLEQVDFAMLEADLERGANNALIGPTWVGKLLKSALTALRYQHESLLSLAAEVERLKRDAERYTFSRNKAVRQTGAPEQMWGELNRDFDAALDAQIDAARAGHGE